MMQKLFVSGFPLEITEMELAQLIGPYGDISTIKIVRDRQTKKCKGYAFIEMVNDEGAQAAIASLNDAEMDGRQLTVKLADVTPARPAPPRRNAYQAYNKTQAPANERTPDFNKAKRPRRPTS